MEVLVAVLLILVVGALMGALVALPLLLLAWLVKPRPRPPARSVPPRTASTSSTTWTDDDEIAARYHH